MNMKKTALLVAASILSIASVYAQNDIQSAAQAAAQAMIAAPEKQEAAAKVKYWKNSLSTDVGFNHTSLTNWAAGGYNTLTMNIGIDGKANYEKGLTGWNNRLQLQYGFLWSADKKNLLQKSADRIYLESKFAYRTSKKSKWNYTASFDFRSQFTDSYDSYVQNEDGNWSGTLKSGFLSPAYANLAIGLAWNPNVWFDLNIAPVTGGFTICSQEPLRYAYGMQLRKQYSSEDRAAVHAAKEYYKFKPALFQFGAQMKANAKVTLNDVLGFETQLVLFTDYLNKPFKNVRVNWDNKLTWSISRFFKVGASTWLIYDPIVLINGERRVQFKENITFSFSYTFKSF